MTAIKDVILKGEYIYKKMCTGVQDIDIFEQLSLRGKIKTYSFERHVCYKCMYLSKLTLNFRFATFTFTDNFNVVTHFVCLVVVNYFDAQYAMQNWKIQDNLL